MRNIRSMGVIQIDVTNACDRTCSNCTRFCGHYNRERIYFMEPRYYEKAIISLKDFSGVVGMIGGEPTLHPRFEELCEILRKHLPDKKRRGLWSNMGPKFRKYSRVIDATFGFFNLNDHSSNPILHTPILVASEDLIADNRITEKEWRALTDNCWIQMTWSATITPKGAYFCEVAGMLDYLFEGSVGWDIDDEPNWWKKNVAEYSAQMEWACRKCGCQLPLKPRRCVERVDDVTESNLRRLQEIGSPKIRKGLYSIFDDGLDPTQVRDCTWYWNEENRSIIQRTLGIVQKILTRLNPHGHLYRRNR